MDTDMFATRGSSGLRKMLGATDLRNKFISNNIANARTPGYVAQDFDFAEFVKTAQSDNNFAMFGLSRTNALHFPQGNALDGSPFHLDGQFVRNFIHYKNPGEEEQMVDLATNSIAYKSAADLISREYRIMNTAVMGGR